VQLKERDPAKAEALKRKICAILENPYQFKPLKAPLHGIRRIHVDPFVLMYEIDESYRIVRLVSFKHHDDAYKDRPDSNAY
jgi:addiction module RelE/StbE family toxin